MTSEEREDLTEQLDAVFKEIERQLAKTQRDGPALVTLRSRAHALMRSLYGDGESGNVAPCAFCTKPAEGNYSVHRDAFGVGPEVDLCDACGGSEEPTLEEIWSHISRTRGVKRPRLSVVH